LVRGRLLPQACLTASGAVNCQRVHKQLRCNQSSTAARLTQPTAMKVDSIRLQGFRNFKDAVVALHYKALIIGYNDVGKTNLTYALRLLLDRSLSDATLEPKDSDFYAHEQTDEIRITLHLVDVTEDCLVSRFRDYLSDKGDVYLVYEAKRDRDTKRKSYRILVGPADDLREVTHRFYLRVLNLRFIEGKRDLLRFIRRERRALLDDAKESRSEAEVVQDDATLQEISDHLGAVNEALSRLTYVNSATDSLNEELRELSHRAAASELFFDAGATDPADFVNNLELAARIEGKSISAGGDGRHNQIQLALWAARNQLALAEGDDIYEVSVFCIEEPEAHLHPHQQRKLATYLADKLRSQVIITTHSPQIAVEFPPESVLRLYDHGPDTRAAGGGPNLDVARQILRFGFRLNIIPAEAFFSSAVLLVEGVSEVMFYKMLAVSLGFDLDRTNISVLSVEGVGFEPYCSLLSALKIPFAVRTDRDLSKIPYKDQYRYAGIQRAMGVCRGHRPDVDLARLPNAELLQGFSKDDIPAASAEAARVIVAELKPAGIFVADNDLEQDLYDAIPDVLAEFTGRADRQAAVREMQRSKGRWMFDFLRAHAGSLDQLAGSDLAAPLAYCVALIRQ
jgi:putative ATP-dependent endonuclease of OLD family